MKTKTKSKITHDKVCEDCGKPATWAVVNMDHWHRLGKNGEPTKKRHTSIECYTVYKCDDHE